MAPPRLTRASACLVEIPTRPTRPPEAMHPVLRLSRTLDRSGPTRVRTTLDLKTQQAAEAAGSLFFIVKPFTAERFDEVFAPILG